MSGRLGFNSVPSSVSGAITQPALGAIATYFNIPVTGFVILFDQPSLTYFDAGQFPQVTVFTGAPFGGAQVLTLDMMRVRTSTIGAGVGSDLSKSLRQPFEELRLSNRRTPPDFDGPRENKSALDNRNGSR